MSRKIHREDAEGRKRGDQSRAKTSRDWLPCLRLSALPRSVFFDAESDFDFRSQTLAGKGRYGDGGPIFRFFTIRWLRTVRIANQPAVSGKGSVNENIFSPSR
jgi:hypothetical protein